MEKEDITSRDCPQGAGQDRIPEVAPTLGTALQSSVRIRTRVPCSSALSQEAHRDSGSHPPP